MSKYYYYIVKAWTNTSPMRLQMATQTTSFNTVSGVDVAVKYATETDYAESLDYTLGNLPQFVNPALKN